MKTDRRVCRVCGAEARMRRNRQDGSYQVYCSEPTCSNGTGWFLSIQGAAVRWHRDNEARSY